MSKDTEEKMIPSICEGCDECTTVGSDGLCDECAEKYHNSSGYCSLSCCLGNGCDQSC